MNVLIRTRTANKDISFSYSYLTEQQTFREARSERIKPEEKKDFLLTFFLLKSFSSFSFYSKCVFFRNPNDQNRTIDEILSVRFSFQFSFNAANSSANFID